MKIYQGKRLNPRQQTASDVEVRVINDAGVGTLLSPGPSQKVWNHSPTGFSWGYYGSGPAQLALAILLDWTGDQDLAVAAHQEFKSEFVGRWGDHWQISSDEINAWLHKRETTLKEREAKVR